MNGPGVVKVQKFSLQVRVYLRLELGGRNSVYSCLLCQNGPDCVTPSFSVYVSSLLPKTIVDTHSTFYVDRVFPESYGFPVRPPREVGVPDNSATYRVSLSVLSSVVNSCRNGGTSPTFHSIWRRKDRKIPKGGDPTSRPTPSPSHLRVHGSGGEIQDLRQICLELNRYFTTKIFILAQKIQFLRKTYVFSLFNTQLSHNSLNDGSSFVFKLSSFHSFHWFFLLYYSPNLE